MRTSLCQFATTSDLISTQRATFSQPSTPGKVIVALLNAAAVVNTPSGWVKTTIFLNNSDLCILTLPAANHVVPLDYIDIGLSATRHMVGYIFEDDIENDALSFVAVPPTINTTNPGGTQLGTGLHTISADSGLAYFGLGGGAAAAPIGVNMVSYDSGFTGESQAYNPQGSYEPFSFHVASIDPIALTTAGVIATYDDVITGAAVWSGIIAYNVGTPVVDVEGPTVVSQDPEDAETAVSVNIAPSITFDEVLAGTPSIAISPVVSGTVNAASNVLTFTPDNPLTLDVTYTITASGLEDASGNTSPDVVYSFTTGVPPVTPIQLLAEHTSPASPTHTITFDRISDPDKDVIIFGNCSAIVSLPAGGWVFDASGISGFHGFVLRLPAASNPGIAQVVLSAPANRPLSAVVVEAYIDGPGPSYVDISNGNDPAGTLWGTGLHTFVDDGAFAIFWSQYAEGSSVESNVLSMDQSYEIIGQASISYGGVGAEGGRVAVGVGGPMTSNGVTATMSAAFTADGMGATGFPPRPGFVVYKQGTPPVDLDAPVLVDQYPNNLDTAVPINTSLWLQFDEVLSGTPDIVLSPVVAGSITSIQNTLTFNPDTLLAEGVAYTVTVTGIEDAAGNTASDIVFSFTTDVDVTPPDIVSRVPDIDASAVDIGTVISLTFDEDLGSGATIDLSPLVSGTVTTVGSVLTFTPDSDLTNGVGYTVTASGIQDAVGNALSDVVWSFTAVALGAVPWGGTIAEEIAYPGDPSTQWIISGCGSTDALGFTDEISYDIGETVNFKVHGSPVLIDIYRIGGYDTGWRKVGSCVNTPTTQPAPDTVLDSNGGTDGANWSTTATWVVPVGAWSGLFVAMPRVTANASYIPFVVRDDSRDADVVVKTSDTTWGMAYNYYGSPDFPFGGKDVYGANGSFGITDRCHFVSLNRPIVTRQVRPQTYWTNAEMPLWRFLDKQGVDWKLIASGDLDKGLTAVGNAKVLVSSGHDEYWSDGMWDNSVAFRDAGGHLIFMTGNEVFWRIRFSADRRGFWCYKDTMTGPGAHVAGVPMDPVGPEFWTGTFQDTRRPGGAQLPSTLTGTFFRLNGINEFSAHIDASEVGSSPMWRGTTVETGTDLYLSRVIGFEANSVDPHEVLNTLAAYTLININGAYADDNGENYSGNGNLEWGIQLQRSVSGGVTAGFGTNQWAFALDGVHDRTNTTPVIQAQQATLNLLIDMGAPPATPTPGLFNLAPAAWADYGLSLLPPSLKTDGFYMSDGENWWEIIAPVNGSLPD